MSKEKPFFCPECGKMFKKQQDLANHCKSTGHKYQDKIDCPYCNRNFGSNQALKQHIHDTHPKESFPLIPEPVSNQPLIEQKENALSISEDAKSGAQQSKMNESEEAFKDWLDNNGYLYFFIDQTSPTQAEQFKTVASRPDFLIKLDENKYIYVDVKQKRLYTETETFTFYKHTQERLSAFEAEFGGPVWIAISTKEDAYRIWHLISLEDIIDSGNLLEDSNGEPFYTIDLKRCYTFGWQDALDKLMDKVEELSETQTKLSEEMRARMEESDTEIKKLKRERRKDKRKFEKEIKKIKSDYMVKPGVKLKEIQKDINEKVSEGVEQLSKNMKKFVEDVKNTFKKKT